MTRQPRSYDVTLGSLPGDTPGVEHSAIVRAATFREAKREAYRIAKAEGRELVAVMTSPKVSYSITQTS